MKIIKKMLFAHYSLCPFISVINAKVYIQIYLSTHLELKSTEKKFVVVKLHKS